MAEAAPLEPGDPRRLGNYEVVGRIGAGGQGAVFLGRGTDGGEVAIKLLHSQMASDPAARARFAREVAAAQKVAPFCTARVLQADVHGDTPFIVSEFIDGPSLHDVVAHNGPLGTVELERLAIGTVTALAAIHEENIVHRDFKPNNVLLASDGPRVVDFGIARTVNSQESAVTATGMVVGTPGYLAPEQLTGAPLQPAVDIFAWGATMVFAATGQSPFEADTLPVIINRILNEDPDLSALQEPLRGLVGRCLSKDAAARPPAAQLLLQLLGHVGAAPASPAAPSEELLGQGTRIASRMAPPPPVPPAPPMHTPPPQPLTPPPMPMHQGFHQGPPPGPATPPPQPITPPPMPMHQGPYQPGPMTPPPQPMTPQPMMRPSMAPGPPPPPQFPPPARQSSSSGPVIAGIGCAVVLVLALVIFVVALAASDGDDDPDPYEPPAYPSASVPSFPSGSSGGDKLPLAFNGAWEGKGFQPSSSTDKTWDVRFLLLGGSTIGTVRYDADSYDCRGSLRLEPGATSLRATYKITITSGSCLSGYVTFTYISSTTLRFEERETLDKAYIASGTLTKE
ncbi:serine/threonine-protein kinase [Thermomonospora umbrina]|uniref:Serine/threonine protein kinase n=1 Tax=Thermomonospora umbrina TaxID=111806 RepID=A0A3D9SQX5_9ACTN|nr:serine/threonine-protein kinase [Thermomonospora umbrina]REE95335.1 serine/threonine protein kinase [Thermomonospora umbrina]